MTGMFFETECICIRTVAEVVGAVHFSTAALGTSGTLLERLFFVPVSTTASTFSYTYEATANVIMITIIIIIIIIVLYICIVATKRMSLFKRCTTKNCRQR